MRAAIRVMVATTCCLLALVAASSAMASPAPAWDLTSLAVPTNFEPGDSGHSFYQVEVTNVGGAETTGADIVITDTLPEGLIATDVDLPLPAAGGGKDDFGPEACNIATVLGVTTVSCTISESLPGTDEPARVGPSEHLTLLVHVAVPGSASGTLLNVAKVSGGGAGESNATSENPAVAGGPAAEIVEFKTSIRDEEGQTIEQAGAHPFQFTTTFAVSTRKAPPGIQGTFIGAGGSIRDIRVELPPGLLANAAAMPRCTPQQFSALRGVIVGGENHFVNECPDDSAVGLVVVRQLEGNVGSTGIGGGAIYNLVPSPGMPAQFGFTIAGAPIFIDTELRSPDYGANAWLRNTSEAKRVSAASVTFWGDPADPIHNSLRGSCAELGGSCLADPNLPAFLRLPTRCDGPLSTVMTYSTWSQPLLGHPRSSSTGAQNGCDLLQFNPTIAVRPTTSTADSPTGLDVDLHVPQNDDPTELATPDLRDAVVKLPRGFTLNPSSANGLEGCTAAQFGLTSVIGAAPIRTTADPADCPNAAKIGTVEVDTPLLDHPLPGAVYVATPYDNPFDSLLAIYIVVADPISGVVIRLAGEVEIGPGGQLTATFSGNPQAPFDHFRLHFFGGDGAVMRTPALCGSYEMTATLTPWSEPQSGPPVLLSEAHRIDQAPHGGFCPTVPAEQPNAPTFEAGSEVPFAGAFSPFMVRLSREDGSQEFSALTVGPPPGLLGRLAGIPYCPDPELALATTKAGRDELAAPSCSPLSRVGSVVVGAGAGPRPFYVTGQAYLAGPYRGAPLSLAVVTPAVAGPYDLGTAVVRAALQIDPRTAEVTVQSDPIPTELKGIPLDVRSIAVRMDRPQFTLNPTSCAEKAVSGTLRTAQGLIAPLADRFQVGNCSALGFKPRIRLRLFGGIRRGDYQGLRAVVRPRPGDANIGRTVARMPRSAFLAQEHIRTVCTRVQFAAESCPRGAVYGRAIAWSPLLDYPLRGNVYLRSSDNTLPDLVADLRGPAHQPLRVELVGRTDSVKGALRNTFDIVPDAPVSYFRLQLFGGKKGLIVNSRDICARKFRVGVRMDAHNGRRAILRPVLHNKRCKAYKRKLRKAKRRAHRSRLPAAKRVDPGLSPTRAP